MRIIDLSQPMEEGMPVFPTHYPYYLLFRRRHRDLARPDGYGSASDVVTFSPHAGTHIDALGHGSEEGKAFGGIPVEELERGGRGLTALDAAEIGPIWRRGLLLDIAALLGRPMKPGEPVGVELLQRALGGRSIQPGDVVLIRTGWTVHYDDRDVYLGAGGIPGLDEAGAEWLAASKPFAVGGDTALLEVSAPGNTARPVHRLFLARTGIHIIENLNLEGLASYPDPFLFVALPLRIKGGTASPIRPVAVVDVDSALLQQMLAVHVPADGEGP